MLSSVPIQDSMVLYSMTFLAIWEFLKASTGPWGIILLPSVTSSCSVFQELFEASSGFFLGSYTGVHWCLNLTKLNLKRPCIVDIDLVVVGSFAAEFSIEKECLRIGAWGKGGCLQPLMGMTDLDW